MLEEVENRINDLMSSGVILHSCDFSRERCSIDSPSLYQLSKIELMLRSLIHLELRRELGISEGNEFTLEEESRFRDNQIGPVPPMTRPGMRGELNEIFDQIIEDGLAVQFGSN